MRGSFGREIFARAFWAGDLSREVAAAATPLLHPSRVDRDCTVLAEWRVVKMVVALVWKVASSRAWWCLLASWSKGSERGDVVCCFVHQNNNRKRKTAI